MNDLDLLEAEAVGFDPMDLARALPGVLKGTGQALDKKPQPSTQATAPTPPAPAPGISLGWKIGGGAALVLLLLAAFRPRPS